MVSVADVARDLCVHSVTFSRTVFVRALARGSRARSVVLVVKTLDLALVAAIFEASESLLLGGSACVANHVACPSHLADSYTTLALCSTSLRTSVGAAYCLAAALASSSALWFACRSGYVSSAPLLRVALPTLASAVCAGIQMTELDGTSSSCQSR